MGSRLYVRRDQARRNSLSRMGTLTGGTGVAVKLSELPWHEKAANRFQDFRRDGFRVSEDHIISFRDPRKEAWDILVLLLAIANSLLIPLEIAFKPTSFKSLAFLIIDNILDLIFLIDFILMFFVSFYSKDGKEVKDSRKIFWKYLRTSRFWTDFLSLFGSSVITSQMP